MSGSGAWIFFAPFDALTTQRSLVWELTKRDILGRYRGANFGLLWSIISPFLMLSIYTFAFGTVLGGRWPEVESGGASFAIVLFAALIVHGFFAECLVKAPALVAGQPALVKRVVFPLDVLPWPMILSAGFHTLANLLVFLLLQIILDGRVHLTALWFPVVLAPLALAALAVGWALSALGAYLRDIGQITPLLSVALLFLSTAMVPISVMPDQYRWLFSVNPLSFIMEQSRDVLVRGLAPDFAGLAFYALTAFLVAVLARALFDRLRKGFADVL
ncbi:ABC transporter permease [Silanimonas lenta]|uniref:ABC transporter permease n=1 Tax=Silanimonas lenta TaxID=265429 RepID=UPI002FDFD686